MAVDGSGNVFVADWDNSAVYEIVAAGGYTTVKNLVPGSFVMPMTWRWTGAAMSTSLISATAQ